MLARTSLCLEHELMTRFMVGATQAKRWWWLTVKQGLAASPFRVATLYPYPMRPCRLACQTRVICCSGWQWWSTAGLLALRGIAQDQALDYGLC